MIEKASIILVDAFLMGERMKLEGSIYLSASRLFSKGCLHKQGRSNTGLFICNILLLRTPGVFSVFLPFVCRAGHG